MKKVIYTAAIAAMTFAGCATEEGMVPPPSSDESSIKFATEVVEMELSRAQPVTGTQFKNGAVIGVYGTETFGGTATAGWMDNMQMRRANDKWSYTAHYFKKGYSYTFFAYAPYKTTLDPTTMFDDPTTVPYKVNADIAQQEDFMYAPKGAAIEYTTTAPGEVAFAFQHALTQVKFKALLDAEYAGYDVQVVSAKLGGLISDGTLDFTKTATPWTLGNTTADYTQTFDALTLTTTAQELTSGSDVLMLLPQEVTDKILTLTVKVTKKAGSNVPEITPAEQDITIKFPAKTWVNGVAYQYTATLNLDAILGWVNATMGEPSITDWTTDEIPITNK